MPTELQPQGDNPTPEGVRRAYEKWGATRVRDGRQKLLYLMTRFHVARKPKSRILVIPDENLTHEMMRVPGKGFFGSFANYEQPDITAHASAHRLWEKVRDEFLDRIATWDGNSIVGQYVGNVLGLPDFDTGKPSSPETIEGQNLIRCLLTAAQHQTGDAIVCGCTKVEPETLGPRQIHLEYSCPLNPTRWSLFSDLALIRIGRLWGFARAWHEPIENDFRTDYWDDWPDVSHDKRRKVWMAFAGPNQDGVRGGPFDVFQRAYDGLLSEDALQRKNPESERGRVDVRRSDKLRLSRRKSPAMGPVRYTLESGSREQVEGFDLPIWLYQGGGFRFNALVKDELTSELGAPMTLDVRCVKVVVQAFDGLERHLSVSTSKSWEASKGGRTFKMTVVQASHPYGYAIKGTSEGVWLPAGWLWNDDDLPIIMDLCDGMGDPPNGARLEVRMEVRQCDLWTRGSNSSLAADQFLQLLKDILKQPNPTIGAPERHDVFRQTHRIRHVESDDADS